LAPQEGASAAPDVLEVRGNKITYDGSPVRLSGVATEDVYNLHVEERDPAKEYGKLARSWRANVVRISLHPSTWRYYESETLTLLEEHVQNATDAGLFVIVDYHVIGFPDGYYEGVPPEWGGPPELYDSDLALVQEFWDAVSTRIQNRHDIFELWNEPV
jgi:aryl-phospho-beta-D-glucosidase BglC (GH1 family)